MKSTEDLGYNHMCLTLIIYVHSVECTSLPVYFFILLYIDATACVDLVYFCLFDMKKVFS